MHDVTALIAKSDKLTAATRRFETVVVCPLVQGFSLLPITGDFAKELSVYASQTQAPLTKPIKELLNGLHALAIEISHDCPVAYISTFYFGGQGGQNALVWARAACDSRQPRYAMIRAGPTHPSAKPLERSESSRKAEWMSLIPLAWEITGKPTDGLSRKNECFPALRVRQGARPDMSCLLVDTAIDAAPPSTTGEVIRTGKFQRYPAI